jgi:hypothetical protein
MMRRRGRRSPEVLAALNQQLHLIAVDLAEMQAREKLLSQRLEQYASVMSQINELDHLERAREQAEQAVMKQQQALMDLQQRIEEQGMPQVYVH